MSGIGGRQWTIAVGDQRVTVTEVGAGLQRYTAGGVDVTVPYGDDVLPPKGCGTTLVPWPNRIRDGRYLFDGAEQHLALSEPDAHNAIHGLGRWERWSEAANDTDRVTLALDVVPQKGYPFQVHTEVTYALAASGLTVTLAARNDGTVRAPFGAGSHPYLGTRGHPLADVTLTLPAGERITTDAQQIPVGTRPVEPDEDFRAPQPLGTRRFDDGFTALATTAGRAEAAVRTASGGATLWLDAAFGFVQVYTVDEMTPGVAGIAVEPMTCPADAFNSGIGLLVLEPGATWSASWGITPD